MYLFAPVLAIGVKQMGKKQLQTVILLVLLVFSVGKTILPFQLASDSHGYDVVWFLCLFLIASYIRLYGMPGVKKSYQGFLLYGVSCVGTFLLALGIAFLSRRLDKFGYFVDSTFDYNHILCLLGAIGLFLGFLYWEMPKGKFASLAVKIAPYTFGVYLLHENREFRYLWPQLLGSDNYGTGHWSVLHWFISILIVFGVGILVDYIRSILFKGIECTVSKLLTGIKSR